MKNIKILVIDSGVDISRKEFENTNIYCLNSCTDDNGHGTAVISIIHKLVPDAQIYVYKLFDNQGCISDVEELITALMFIDSLEHFDIIHLSCCSIACGDQDGLYEICLRLVEKGTIIVSPFDNEGSISYPAAFDCVIGVDWNLYSRSGMSYIYLKNNPINILGPGCLQRLPWLGGSYKYVSGSSFAAPYITAAIAKLMASGIRGLQAVHNGLEKNAYDVWYHPVDYKAKKQLIKPIHKAIVLPFNKEIHSLIAYKNLMSFEIKGVYEVGLFRHVGKKVLDILPYTNCDMVINPEKDIDWESGFDTVILGHCRVISSIMHRDIISEILDKCTIYQKNLYCFDDLSPYEDKISALYENNCWAYYPKVDKTDVDDTFMTKLYGIYTPTVGVFGTSTKQGKFTLQLALKQRMEEIGYRVGGIGTEPSSLLFGFDYVYPMGYENSVSISGGDAVKTLNRFMHEIDLKKYDLILAASQSQTVPHNMGNLHFYPIAQHEFLLGTEPNVIVLCINPFDEISYISRTITYLESYIDTKVIALSLYPCHRDFEWSIGGTLPKKLSEEKLMERKKYYCHKTGVPCFVLGNPIELDELIDLVTNFFVE